MEAEEIALRLLEGQEADGIDNPSILVKAAAGGGGMGIEEVTEIEHFRRIYRQLQNYAKRQFGDGGVLIEQCLRDYNHLEVQLVCSKHGERIHFGTRNCTIQSTGRQKRVEASPGFHPSCFAYDFDEQKVLDQIVEYSLKLAAHVNYDNVGTWEWIVSRSGQPYLLEVNTRIQVENDISARISYINGRQPNLLREQIRLGPRRTRIGYRQADVDLPRRPPSSCASSPRIPDGGSPRGSAPSPTSPSRSTSGRRCTPMSPSTPYPIPSDFDPISPWPWSGATRWTRPRPGPPASSTRW